jgi:molybdopterin-guanine dinucleotide biosynthesis protein A
MSGNSTTCIGAVLIGGKSTRMGAPKHALTLPVGGRMIDCVVDALKLACGRVVIVDGLDSTQAWDLPSVKDLRPNAGPLGGIEALLSSDMAGQYVVCPCDLPLVTAPLLQLLMKNQDALASVFQPPGRANIDPLPARLRAEVLPVVRRLLNTRPLKGGARHSVDRLMSELAPHVVRISAEQAIQLQNVNTPDDYRQALRMMKQVE